MNFNKKTAVISAIISLTVATVVFAVGVYGYIVWNNYISAIQQETSEQLFSETANMFSRAEGGSVEVTITQKKDGEDVQKKYIIVDPVALEKQRSLAPVSDVTE